MGSVKRMKLGDFLRRVISWTLVTLALFQSDSAFAWGNEGHTYVNRVAAEKIPLDMPKFFRRAAAVNELAYLGPEPDRWRSPTEFALKNSQEPDHFIDMERVSWLDPLPLGRYEFYRKLYEKRAATTDHPDDYLPERVGLQPYITMEVYGRLKAAFREYRQRRATHQPTAAVEQTIIFYAGWLGHYVADGSQPLHTTIQYNGWVGPNPNGYTTEHKIHSQFEGPFVDANLHEPEVRAKMTDPKALEGDMFDDYVAYLRQTNTHVEQVYQLEKAGGFVGEGTAESREFTAERLAAGDSMLRDMF